VAVHKYRADYARFICVTPAGTFRQYYNGLCRAAEQVKFYGEWSKTHKVNALHSQNPAWETTAIDIWGEWAGIVFSLPWEPWGKWLKRFDVRAIVWDASDDAIIGLGQYLQRNVTNYNVEVFSSKPASKRMGRDRGGKGLRLGSRKSDLCVVIYKRHQEPAACEFRFQGQVLANFREMITRDIGGNEAVLSPWANLVQRSTSAGETRLNNILEKAGIGTYWPVFSSDAETDYTSSQQSFAAMVDEVRVAPDYEGHPADYAE
jgi:hypothetical protein